MIARATRFVESRVGLARLRAALLDEPVPSGTGLFFTLGSVVLALLTVQLLTGAFLTLYYAPTPDHAYESVRFIEGTGAGRLVRGLHHAGASFLVVFVVLHALRVIAFGSYKAPREVTWLTGVALLVLVLAFALTGYLLPWDQRAYWATVVTINIARLAPLGGDVIAALLQGGPKVGALTLTRWYAAHVVFLPALLVLLVVGHLALMRRHGISGPIRPRAGAPQPFYPYHASRDVAAGLVVLLMLVAIAWRGAPALEAPVDPADPAYVPRPEWYFLGLFQLLKYFPGRLEIVGAILIPTLLFLLLAALPWIDRRRDRRPRARPVVMAGTATAVVALVVLTALGWRDRPVASPATEAWSLREIAGRGFVSAAGCVRCHTSTGPSSPLEDLPVTRDAEWLTSHVDDPEMIAPGLREPPAPPHERETRAIAAYIQRLTRGRYPGFPPRIEIAAAVHARHCIGCHVIDGEGGTDGPDLSQIGARHHLEQLRLWIADPEAIDPDAEMPSFASRLTPEQLDAIASYLADRR